MKKFALLMLAPLMLIGPANATTLEVTSGFLISNEISLGDILYQFSGPGFAIPPGSAPSVFSFFDLGIGAVPINFASGLTVGSTSYLLPPDVATGVNCCNVNLLFTQAPVDRAAVPLTIPFTMTGGIRLVEPMSHAPVTFDLAGHGTLDVFSQSSPVTGPNLNVRYTFVPEPSTMSLISLMLPPLALTHRLCSQRRNGRPIRRRKQCAGFPPRLSTSRETGLVV